jgi:hypothetical protein
MKEDENITTYFLQVDKVVNSIKVLGDEMKEKVFVQKVLRTLPMRFDLKISVIEEITDLDTFSMDEILGIFTTYEMRIE